MAPDTFLDMTQYSIENKFICMEMMKTCSKVNFHLESLSNCNFSLELNIFLILFIILARKKKKKKKKINIVLYYIQALKCTIFVYKNKHLNAFHGSLIPKDWKSSQILKPCGWLWQRR